MEIINLIILTLLFIALIDLILFKIIVTLLSLDNDFVKFLSNSFSISEKECKTKIVNLDFQTGVSLIFPPTSIILLFVLVFSTLNLNVIKIKIKESIKKDITSGGKNV